ncbi:MAG: hypothetical protein HYV94_04625 [Candidatus Rokubacteria bacterium]|nr:hypothetical protein [Candidatus Rokubacteria bacterium]
MLLRRRRPLSWLRGASLLLPALLVVLPAHAGDRAGIPLKNWGGFSVFRDAVYDDLERLAAA